MVSPGSGEKGPLHEFASPKGVSQGQAKGTLPEVRGSSRRSYQMPVRDEESESQRKARSRLMRQSRRSTQVWGAGWDLGPWV